MLLKAANDNTPRALGRMIGVRFAAKSAWIVALGTLVYWAHGRAFGKPPRHAVSIRDPLQVGRRRPDRRWRVYLGNIGPTQW